MKRHPCSRLLASMGGSGIFLLAPSILRDRPIDLPRRHFRPDRDNPDNRNETPVRVPPAVACIGAHWWFQATAPWLHARQDSPQTPKMTRGVERRPPGPQWPGGKSEHGRTRWWVTPTCRAGDGPVRDSATENRPLSAVNQQWVRVKRCGKSAPLCWQQHRHGKPHRVQGQAVTPAASSGWLVRPARNRVVTGRPHEPAGNDGPSQMVALDRIRLMLHAFYATGRRNPGGLWPFRRLLHIPVTRTDSVNGSQ